ncbi:MAG: hypothetical protein II456_03840 [Firmicutes bacterium]|nr:hypothetical protein [Bacillota bacterium]
MTLKGNYSGLTSYSVGDVVCFQDVFYLKNKASGAGVVPTDTKAWERLGKMASLAAKFAMDMSTSIVNNLTTTTAGKALDARQGKALKELIDMVNPDSKTIRLASSTASSTKLFDITVDDDGELSATEYTPAT